MKNNYDRCYKDYEKKNCMQRKINVNSCPFKWNIWVLLYPSKIQLVTDFPIPKDQKNID